MNKILTIARWELTRGLKSKAFIISMFMPFVVLVISILPTVFTMNSQVTEKDMGIIDQGNGIYEELIVHFEDELRSKDDSALYTIQEYVSTQANHDTLVNTLVKDGIVDILLVIKPDFINTANVDIYHNDAVGLQEVSSLRSVMKRYSMEKRILKLGLTPDDMDYVMEKPQVVVYEIGESGETEKSNLIVKYGVPGVFLWLLVMGVVMSSSMLIGGVIEERSNRIIELLVSSVKPNQLMAGKILGIGMLGVIQIMAYLVIILVFTLFGGSYLDIELTLSDIFTIKVLWYFIYFIMGYFLYASLYISLGSLYDNERDASQSVGFISLFAVLPLMLVQPIMFNPNTNLDTILAFIPLTTPFMMILKIGVLSAPLWEILAMMVYLGLWIWLIVMAGSKVFKTTLLMYGKRATLKEIIQWIKN